MNDSEKMCFDTNPTEGYDYLIEKGYPEFYTLSDEDPVRAGIMWMNVVMQELSSMGYSTKESNILAKMAYHDMFDTKRLEPNTRLVADDIKE